MGSWIEFHPLEDPLWHFLCKDFRAFQQPNTEMDFSFVQTNIAIASRVGIFLQSELNSPWNGLTAQSMNVCVPRNNCNWSSSPSFASCGMNIDTPSQAHLFYSWLKQWLCYVYTFFSLINFFCLFWLNEECIGSAKYNYLKRGNVQVPKLTIRTKVVVKMVFCTIIVVIMTNLIRRITLK